MQSPLKIRKLIMEKENKSWALGFLGLLAMGAGVIAILIGILGVYVQGAKTLPLLAFGIAILAVGSFMRRKSSK